MKLIGIIADHPTPKATLDEVMFTTGASDSHRGGGTVWCIGNGQVHDALQIEKDICKTLNCMVDPMKILIVRNDES